jgi:hypothetical protein
VIDEQLAVQAKRICDLEDESARLRRQLARQRMLANNEREVLRGEKVRLEAELKRRAA